MTTVEHQKVTWQSLLHEAPPSQPPTLKPEVPGLWGSRCWYPERSESIKQWKDYILTSFKTDAMFCLKCLAEPRSAGGSTRFPGQQAMSTVTLIIFSQDF